MAKFAAVALLLAACAESTQAVNPTIAPPGITREVPTPASLIAPEPTDEPIPPTPVPTEAVTPTPDLRIPVIDIQRATSYLGVALPGSEAAIPGKPYAADVYSETFLRQQLAAGSLSPETQVLYQTLLEQIQSMRAAPGVGGLCGPDSLVLHNGRFGSYFRAMPVCLTPDGKNMVWLEGRDGQLSGHASVVQGIDASRFRWTLVPLPTGTSSGDLGGVVDGGALVLAVERSKGHGADAAFVPSEKRWVGAERLPTSCLDGEQNQKIVDQFLAANGFSDLKEAMSDFVNKYGEGKRVWMRYIIDPATQKTIGYSYQIAYTETLLLGEYQISVNRNGQSGYLYCPVVALPAANPDGANVLALISDGTLNGVWSGRPIYDSKGHVVDVQNTPRTEAEARRWFTDRVGKSIAVRIPITAPQWKLEGDGTQDWCFNYYYPFADCPLGDGGEIQHRSVLLPLAENSYLTRFENDISLLEAITDPEYFDPADVAKHLDPELDLGLFATGFHD